MPTPTVIKKSTKPPSSLKASTTANTRDTKRSRSSKQPARRDAIAILKADHRDVAQLFRAFEKAGDGAMARKQQLASGMISALSTHAAIEEQILYPWIRTNIEDADPSVLEALEEHHVVKWLLSEIEGLAPGDERFDAKVTVLIESVRHHVEEEETEMFVDLRQVATRAELLLLGDELTLAKRHAPTRPHPRSSDTPPANLIGGTVNAAFDHAREVGKDVVGALASNRR